MRIRALSVFERIVYHCHCVDASDPGPPTLEVDALLREGDADGPLLVTVADYKRMVGFDAAAHAPARPARRRPDRPTVGPRRLPRRFRRAVAVRWT